MATLNLAVSFVLFDKSNPMPGYTFTLPHFTYIIPQYNTYAFKSHVLNTNGKVKIFTVLPFK
jgi:hypothetical protein